MSEEKEHLSKKTVVYTMPGMEAVTVRRDEPYRTIDNGALTMDLYYPPDTKSGEPRPAAIIVAGFPDSGYQRFVGCKFKEMGFSVSWGKLIAASGMVAITYANQEPEADVQALLRFVRENAASLGIDEKCIGIWASSGNVPLTLSVLMQESSGHFRCAVLCYGYTLDLDGSTGVAEASKSFGFVNPTAGKSVEDLPRDLPLFVARAGKETFAHLNEALDRFVARALSANLPLTLVNHAEGPHSFDLFHDSEISREIIRGILAFMRFHLAP